MAGLFTRNSLALLLIPGVKLGHSCCVCLPVTANPLPWFSVRTQLMYVYCIIFSRAIEHTGLM